MADKTPEQLEEDAVSYVLNGSDRPDISRRVRDVFHRLTQPALELAGEVDQLRRAIRGLKKHYLDRAEGLAEEARRAAALKEEYGRAAELYGKSEGYSAALRQLVHTIPADALEPCPRCGGTDRCDCSGAPS